jgi:hypothetical protein
MRKTSKKEKIHLTNILIFAILRAGSEIFCGMVSQSMGGPEDV